jgi:hypothetical protein
MNHVNLLIRVALIGVAVLAGGHALAQTASAPAAAASQPQEVPRYGQIYTPGWTMMSKDERDEYAAAMGQLKNRAECVAFMTKHYELMSRRALQRNLPLPDHARLDLCNVLPN